MSSPANAAATVVVEVLAFSLDDSGVLVFRAARSPVLTTPDETVLSLVGGRSDGPLISHSTSWRWEPGQVVLTYAVLPDPTPNAFERYAVAADLARSLDPAAPSPASVEVGQVAAHAVRHLAYVSQTDPVVRAEFERTGLLASIIRTHDLAMAGQIAP